MDILALSTRIASGAPRIDEALRPFLDLGFRAFALHPELRERDWELLKSFAPRGSVAAAWLFAPLHARAGAEPPPPPRLGSLDPDERREAIKRGRECIEFADRSEIPIVAAPPVVLAEPSPEEVHAMLAGPAAKRSWKRLRERRAGSREAARQVDSFLGTLARLLDHADRYRIRVAMVPGGLPCEAPDLGEIERCLAEFAGAPLSVLGDTLRLERCRRSGGPDAAEWIARLETRLAGAVVHDGDAIRERRPLGEGEADLEPWRALVRKTGTGGDAGSAGGAPRTWILDLEAGTDPDAALASRARLESLLSPRAAGESGTAESRGRARPSFLDTSLRDPL